MIARAKSALGTLAASAVGFFIGYSYGFMANLLLAMVAAACFGTGIFLGIKIGKSK